MQIDFERAVIATFIFADMSQAEETIRNTELKEEWFTDHNHRLIVHAINHLKAGGFYDELTVKDYLEKDSRFDIRALENCMIANIAGSSTTLKTWVNKIKNSVRNQHAEVEEVNF